MLKSGFVHNPYIMYIELKDSRTTQTQNQFGNHFLYSKSTFGFFRCLLRPPRGLREADLHQACRPYIIVAIPLQTYRTV